MNEGENRRRGERGGKPTPGYVVLDGLGPTEVPWNGVEKGVPERESSIMGCTACQLVEIQPVRSSQLRRGRGLWERGKSAFVICTAKDCDCDSVTLSLTPVGALESRAK